MLLPVIELHFPGTDTKSKSNMGAWYWAGSKAPLNSRHKVIMIAKYVFIPAFRRFSKKKTVYNTASAQKSQIKIVLFR